MNLYQLLCERSENPVRVGIIGPANSPLCFWHRPATHQGYR
jgi:hypothetical protein